jgi:hypothetical protein
MLAQRLALIFRITRIAELVKVLGIVTIVASMSVIPTYAQSHSIKERVASPVGPPRLPPFQHFTNRCEQSSADIVSEHRESQCH